MWSLHPKMHQKEKREAASGQLTHLPCTAAGALLCLPKPSPSSVWERLLNGAGNRACLSISLPSLVHHEPGFMVPPSPQKPKGGDCDMGRKQQVHKQSNTLVCCSQNILISAGGLLPPTPGQLAANGQGWERFSHDHSGRDLRWGFPRWH